MSFMSFAVTAIFVQNVILVLVLCDPNYFKLLKSPVSGFAYGISLTVVTTVASMLAWLVYRFFLKPYSLEWLTAFAYILIIAVFEIAAELIISAVLPKKKVIFRKLLTASAFSCAVLGIVINNIQNGQHGIFGAGFYGLCAGIGFMLSLFINANALERVRFSTPPTVFKGLPIALITTGIISLAFMGFARIEIPY